MVLMHDFFFFNLLGWMAEFFLGEIKWEEVLHVVGETVVNYMG